MSERRGRPGGADVDPFAPFREGGWGPDLSLDRDDLYEPDPSEPYWARQDRTPGPPRGATPAPPPVIPEIPSAPQRAAGWAPGGPRG
ncbi:MAG: hypothetical protein ACFCVG_19120, partial [Kineosporiaceae bacterium]